MLIPVRRYNKTRNTRHTTTDSLRSNASGDGISPVTCSSLALGEEAN